MQSNSTTNGKRGKRSTGTLLSTQIKALLPSSPNSTTDHHAKTSIKNSGRVQSRPSLIEDYSRFINSDDPKSAMEYRRVMGLVSNKGATRELDTNDWPQYNVITTRKYQQPNVRASIDPLPPISGTSKAINATTPSAFLNKLLSGARRTSPQSPDPNHTIHMARLALIDGRERVALEMLKQNKDACKVVDLTRLTLRALLEEADTVVQWIFKEGFLHPDDLIYPTSKKTLQSTKKVTSSSKKTSPLKILMGRRSNRHTRRPSGKMNNQLHRSLIPTFFFVAILTKQSETVLRTLLERGAYPNTRWMGLTALQLAIEQGRLAIVRMLLEFRADLMLGVSLKTYQRLLKLGTPSIIPTTTQILIHPLDMAMRHHRIATHLLTIKPLPDYRNSLLAHLLCTDLDLTIRMLKGDIPLEGDTNGRTPLHYAASRGALDQLAVMAHFHPQLINQQSKHHSWYRTNKTNHSPFSLFRTPAHEAAAAQQSFCLAFLLDHPLYKNVMDSKEHSPEQLYHSSTELNYDEGEIRELIKQVQRFDLDDSKEGKDPLKEEGSDSWSRRREGSRFRIERMGNSFLNWLTNNNSR